MACERAAAVGVVKEGRNMKKPHWTRKSHLFREDEYVCSKCGSKSPHPCKSCPRCGTSLAGTKYDLTWVEEAEGLAVLMDDDW